MLEAQAGGGQSVEDQQRELQAELDRLRKVDAEYSRRVQAGELVERSSYDETIQRWARDEPEKARNWLGWGAQEQPQQNGGSAGYQSASQSGTSDYDPQIFVEGSEAQQAFRSRYGDEGWSQAYIENQMAPKLRRSLGLDELIARDKARDEQIASLQQQLEEQRAQVHSAWDRTELLANPKLKAVRETIGSLEKDASQWYPLQEKLDGYDALKKELEDIKAAQAASKAAQPSATPVTPEQHAEHIRQAQGIPQGSGAGTGAVPSPGMDPFDQIAQKALNSFRGTPVAA